MKTALLYIILLVATLFMPGCIREDENDCPVDSSIYFSYVGDETDEIFSSKIDDVILYVYNEQNMLEREIYLNKQDLDKRQGVVLDMLPAGKYHVVCWGNPHEYTQMNEVLRLEDAILGAPNYFLDEDINTNDSLYFGRKDIVIPNTDTDTIKFKGAHVKIRVLIDEEDINKPHDMKLRNTSTVFKIEVDNLSPTINFDKITSDKLVSYYPVCLLENEYESCADFNVLPFNDNNNIHIHLKNIESGNTIYTLTLADFMRENNISIDNKNEVKLGIRFRFKGAAITVSAWDEEDIKPGI